MEILPELLSRVATSHLCLWSTWNVAGVTEEYIFNCWIFIYLNVDGHVWLLCCTGQICDLHPPSCCHLSDLISHFSHLVYPMPATWALWLSPTRALAVLFLGSSSPGWLHGLSFYLCQVCTPLKPPQPLPSSPWQKTAHFSSNIFSISFPTLLFSLMCVTNPAQFCFLAYYLTLPLDHIPWGEWLLPVLFPAYSQHLGQCSTSICSVNEQAEVLEALSCLLFLPTLVCDGLCLCVVSDFWLWAIPQQGFFLLVKTSWQCPFWGVSNLYLSGTPGRSAR